MNKTAVQNFVYDVRTFKIFLVLLFSYEMETNHICSSQPWYGIDRFSDVSEYEIYPKSAGTQNRQFVSFIPRYLIFFQNCSDSFIDKI